MKTCSKCNQIKELSQFYKDKTEKDGFNNQCKACVALKQKRHYNKNPKARTAIKRKWEMIRKYGITVEQYNEMVVQQNGLCKICNQPETDPHKKLLSVDHSHITGKVRGLLCNRCNRGLGLFNDSLDIVEKVALYLRVNDEDQSAGNRTSKEL